jgi:hypothetical protein
LYRSALRRFFLGSILPGCTAGILDGMPAAIDLGAV